MQADHMQAQVEQWIDFTTQEIDAPMLSWFLPIIGYMEYNKKVCSLQRYLSLSLHQDVAERKFACCTSDSLQSSEQSEEATMALQLGVPLF